MLKSDQMLNKIQLEFIDLPLHDQKQVLEFIESLKTNREDPDLVENINFTDLGFVGIWADRDDMKDSSEWVRQIRGREWRDAHGRSDPC